MNPRYLAASLLLAFMLGIIAGTLLGTYLAIEVLDPPELYVPTQCCQTYA